MELVGFTYILTNAHNTVLYVGVTSDLIKRVYQHKSKTIPGFTSEYNVDKLIYFEKYDSITEAIKHEKRLKKYTRQQKENLINGANLEWRDLYEEITL